MPTSLVNSSVEFLDVLAKSKLIDPTLLRQQLQAMKPLPPDAGGISDALVREKLLTPFQAQLLLAGKFRGFHLGSYIVQDQLGKGGMGVVYLAEHESLRRKVAIKMLKSTEKQTIAFERFLREARSVAALDHPNIVRIYDVVSQGKLQYLIMEYVEGVNLETKVQQQGPLPIGRAIDYILQAAAGLQHAYEKGFVHRDIKPANIMVTSDGVVKILDMGLARSTVEDGDRLTEVLDKDAIVGTADFIAPEQAMGESDVDVRADIYSLGVTLFMLVSGRVPFHGSTTQKIMQHQLKEAPQLADVDPTILPELSQIVAKMMAKDRNKRYQTPAEVVEALAPWLGTPSKAAEVSASTAGHTRTRTKTPSKRDDSKPNWFWPAIGTAAAAVCALVGWAIFGGRGSEQPTVASSAVAQQSAAPIPVPNPPQTSEPTLTKPEPKKATPSKSGASKAATGNAKVTPSLPQMASNVLYKLDLSTQKEFTDRGRTTRKVGQMGDWESEKQTGTPGLPAGWMWLNWSTETVSEYSAKVVDGQMALGFMHCSGSAKSSMLFMPELEFPQSKARIQFEYKCESSSGGVDVWFKQMGPKEERARTIPDALCGYGKGDWQIKEIEIDLKGGTRGYFEFHQVGVETDKPIWIRGVVVTNPAIAQAEYKPLPEGADLVKRFDFGHVQQFRSSFSNGKADANIGALLPTGTGLHCWKAESIAEFRAAEVAGKTGVGMTNLNEHKSSQLVAEKLPELMAGTATYRLMVEYLTANDAIGSACVRIPSENYKMLGNFELPNTQGSWKTATVDFQRPAGSAEPDIQILNESVGEGNTLYIHKIEIVRLK
jgi:eukaryotic-like serine/threonine-protein kinase